MKISKITTVLPIVMAMTVCGVFAEEKAEDYTDNANVVYQLTLEDYVKITALTEDVSYTSETKFGTDYSNITIDGTLKGGFNVISNAPSRTMDLTATCPGGGATPAFFGGAADGSTFNLIFAKTGATEMDSAIEDIKKATPAPDNNANAIAFGVTVATTHEHGGAAGIVGEWDEDKITYTMANGVSDITYTISGSNVAGTFNTKDESGEYTATLTLTDKSHI